MQYPIIDLITGAYINNGWTGLDNTNIENINFQLSRWINADGTESILPSGALSDFIEILIGGLYLYTPEILPDLYSYAVVLYDSNREIVNRIYHGINELSQPITVNIPSGYFLRVQFSIQPWQMITNDNINEQNITLYNTTGQTIEYDTTINMISHRLKLPLPHYFPHPVIDALQRAAAGTQTADDTEILRHYLTPLGIGGI